MIVDDVEQDHHVEAVRRVDQSPELVGRPIGMVRRIGQNAVIAPAALALKFGNGHDLDGGDTRLGEKRQPFGRRSKRALGREAADMQLRDDRFLPRQAAPRGGFPPIGGMVDEHRGA